MIEEKITERTKKIILASVFILSAFLITFHFTDTPKVWVDEGVFTETARNLATHGVLGLQTAPGEFFSMRNFLLSTSYPVIFPVALSFNIFNIGIWQARLPMLFYMFILVILFYFFVKKKYGFYPAVLSVLMLLSFSPFYGNGRPVQGEVPGLVFVVLGVLLLLNLENLGFKDKKLTVFSGLAFGLAASTKPIFLVLIPISLLISLFFSIRKIENKNILWLFLLGFVPPILLWLYIHVPTTALFISFVSKSFYLASNHDVASESSVVTILRNFTRFFTESTPILFSFLFITVVTAFFLRFKKSIIQTFSISEYILLFFIILNIASYLVGTGWYRYFFPAHVLIYLLFPGSLFTIYGIFKNSLLKKFVFSIPILLIIFQFYHLIFLSDTSFVVSRTRNIELQNVLGQIDSSKKVLFYSSIEPIVFLKSQNYSQYLLMGDFLEAGDKDVGYNSKFDIILTSGPEDAKFNTSCYQSEHLSQYLLYRRLKDCK